MSWFQWLKLVPSLISVQLDLYHRCIFMHLMQNSSVIITIQNVIISIATENQNMTTNYLKVQWQCLINVVCISSFIDACIVLASYANFSSMLIDMFYYLMTLFFSTFSGFDFCVSIGFNRLLFCMPCICKSGFGVQQSSVFGQDSFL